LEILCWILDVDLEEKNNQLDEDNKKIKKFSSIYFYKIVYFKTFLKLKREDTFK